MFYDRWSPRAFAEKPLTEEQIWSLFEAARWAPSAYNAQPWVFFFARTPEDRARFLEPLAPMNRRWARRAPLLIYLVVRRHRDGVENPWARFDAGAAWMSLALQARRLGLYAHAMAGFDREKAYRVLNLSEDAYDVVCAIAVGYREDPDVLPEPLRAREHPNARKPLAEVAREGVFSSETTEVG